MQKNSYSGTARSRVVAITETGLFAAIVFIGVFLIKIPVPGGYIHLGDSMVFLAVMFLGTRRGALAGGVGAAMADMIAGYTFWIVPTLIAKALMGVVFGVLAEKNVFSFAGRFHWVIAAVIGGVAQAVIYLSCWYIFFGKAAAIVAIGGLSFQTVSGVIIAGVLIALLGRTVLRKKFAFKLSAKGA